jgi:hypothetical protein
MMPSTSLRVLNLRPGNFFRVVLGVRSGDLLGLAAVSLVEVLPWDKKPLADLKPLKFGVFPRHGTPKPTISSEINLYDRSHL